MGHGRKRVCEMNEVAIVRYHEAIEPDLQGSPQPMIRRELIHVGTPKNLDVLSQWVDEARRRFPTDKISIFMKFA